MIALFIKMRLRVIMRVIMRYNTWTVVWNITYAFTQKKNVFFCNVKLLSKTPFVVYNWLWLLMFRPIRLKQLNLLTKVTINSYAQSSLWSRGNAWLRCQSSRVRFLALKGVLCLFLFWCYCDFTLLVPKLLFVTKFSNYFCTFIFLVHLTCYNMCDQL